MMADDVSEQDAPQEQAPPGGWGGRNPPPPETRFKPGQSGNPGGRPKGASLTAPILRLLAEDKNEHGEGRLAVATAKRFLEVVQGKVEAEPTEIKATLALWERADGAVVKEIHQETEELTIRLLDRPPAQRPEP